MSASALLSQPTDEYGETNFPGPEPALPEGLLTRDWNGNGKALTNLRRVSLTSTIGDEQPLAVSHVLTGDLSVDAPANWASSDFQLDDSASFGAAFGSAVNIGHHLTDGWDGRRNSFQNQLFIDAPWGGTAGGEAVSGYFGVKAYQGFGGTDTTALGAKGGVFALSLEVIAYEDCENLGELTCGEFNVTAKTGSSIRYKNILSLVYGDGDQVQGDYVDCCLAISSQVNGLGVAGATLEGQGGRAKHAAIMIGDMNSNFPLDVHADIIRTSGYHTIGSVFDVSGIELQDAFCKVRSSPTSMIVRGLGTYCGKALKVKDENGTSYFLPLYQT